MIALAEEADYSIQMGNYDRLAESNMFEFDTVVRCTISRTGAWQIDAVHFGKYTRDNFDDILFRNYIMGRANREIWFRTEEERAERACVLARYILENQLWNQWDGTVWKMRAM